MKSEPMYFDAIIKAWPVPRRSFCSIKLISRPISLFLIKSLMISALWPTIKDTLLIPEDLNMFNIFPRIVVSPKGNIGFGISFVRGDSLTPLPAARITASIESPYAKAIYINLNKYLQCTS